LLTPERIRGGWEKVVDWTDATNPADVNDSTTTMIAQLNKSKESGLKGNNTSSTGKSDAVDVALALSYKFKSSVFDYTERDVSLYALAIGATEDPLDDSELKFTYDSHAEYQTFPTFGVLFPATVLDQLLAMPGLKYNPMLLLHGGQRLEIKRPIPTSGKLTTNAKISHIYDKGKGAVIIVDASTRNASGEEICTNEITIYIRGIGGFGGERGPSDTGPHPPNRPPDAIKSDKTKPNQAVLYRLCGDKNPLHVDPSMAAIGGFEKPILHGLCTFGYAGRAVAKHFGNNESRSVKSIGAKFTRHVYPGETIVTEMWKVSPNRVFFQSKVAERPDAYALSSGVVELDPASSISGSPTSAVSTNYKSKL